MAFPGRHSGWTSEARERSLEIRRRKRFSGINSSRGAAQIAAHMRVKESRKSETIEKLYREHDTPQAAAGNRRTSSELLSELSKHKDRTIRMAVASNPSTSRDVLMRMLRDSHQWVRNNAELNLNSKK